MAKQQKLYLFGDQTYDVRKHLKSLLQYRDNPVLEQFLSKAYEAVRLEIYNLSPSVRDALPRFTSLNDLILWEHNGVRCIPLEMAVTCIYQIGLFIIQVDSEPKYPDAGNARVLGLCTGALVAAAVSCSRSPVDLIPMAVDSIIAAFRIGMHVAETAERLEPNGAFSQSWSILVGGSSTAEALETFYEQTIMPKTKMPYISAYSPSGITISGPPSSLSFLRSSDSFKELRSKTIPIYGPYHCPLLSSETDVDEILEGLAPATGSRPNQTPVISSTGDTVGGEDFRTLLKLAVAQILMHPIQWKGVIEELQSWLWTLTLQSKSPEAFGVVPIATNAEQLIYSALKESTSILPAPTRPPPGLNITDSSPKKPKLAIIGMSGRYPDAKDNGAFWDLLHQGLDVHKPVPDFHWNQNTHVDPTGKAKNTSATPFGCWLDDPGQFDARFFNISPREAEQVDPAQRLALLTAYEAIEQAGLVPDATPSTRRDRVGVFYGVTSNDWMETNSAQAIDAYFIPGGNRAFIPGRINYCFKFSGPSYAVDTACSSSLAGIHIACNSLWRGDIDTAIAGGTNVLTNPDFTAGLDRGHFLSRTGNCKTFDDGADGYCRGEGIGSVIIKRLDDALADNDPIQAVILGAYTNHSAESESITRPHVGAQRAIFNKILNEGAVDPYDISYVEMHGTGTQAGDAGEMSSVLSTFAPPLENGRKARAEDQALYLGSAKANIGHGEAASGVTSLVKVLLMMQKNTIVPHCGIKDKINHRFPTDLADRNVNIAREATPWQRPSSKPRRAFVNNFSAAGGNSALLLEDAPARAVASELDDGPKRSHPIAISGKNGASLSGNLRSMLEYLKQNPEVRLDQLSYTTTARRIHHLHRVMVTATKAEDACTQLEAALRDGTGMKRPKSASKIMFTFTGNGAQYPGMGKELFESFTRFRAEIRRLDQLGQSLGFPSILPVIQSEEKEINVFQPTAVQLATTCLQIALARLWKSWGVEPTAVVGHSLGEYSALNIAGVLSDSDTLYLVGRRAQLLEEKCTLGSHSMLVVKGSLDAISATLKGKEFEVACINSPVETVVAGPKEQVATFKDVLEKEGIKSTLLSCPFAFHSTQVDPILEPFAAIAEGVTFSKPRMPILCPLNGSIIDDEGKFDSKYLSRHCREPVNILDAIMTAQKDGIITDQTAAVEIGPHPAVSGMIAANLPQVTTLPSIQRGRPAFDVLMKALKALYCGGADIRWLAYHSDFKASHTVLQLPAYSWDLKDYWMQYVNDWSLRKGDPPIMEDSSSKTKLLSTTVHRVVQETSDSHKANIVVEANIAREDLRPLVQGHEVDGIPLCTPSVYADIALSLGTYLVDQYQPDKPERLVDVGDMTISKALILREKATEQRLQAHCDVDWHANEATIVFMSFDAKEKLQEHSRCTVRYQDRSLLETLRKKKDETKEKMRALRESVANETAARFNRPMVYRMIRPLARFHDDYRAIDEIILDSKTLEAASKLSFGSVKKGGDFHTHPAIIDSLTQSCGFAMNCNDGTDLDKEVFMNHGWSGFQIFAPIDFEKAYTTYTRMHEGEDKLWHGDVVIFDGDEIVASFKSIAIQGVPRRVLQTILSIESGNKSKGQGSAPKAQAPQTSKKESAPQPKQEAASASSAQYTKALEIVAEESGLDASDFTDGTVFADAGIDSLMGLTISSRLKEELGLDLDFNGLFFEYPTPADLKKLLGETDAGTPSSSAESSGSNTPSSPQSSATGVTTPDEGIGGDFKHALSIISEESGVAVEDFTDDAEFVDCGVDSLLSLVLVSRFRDELGMDIPHESLFLECPRVADLRKLVEGDKGNGLAELTELPEALETEAAKSSDPEPEPTQESIPEPVVEPKAAETEQETSTTTRKKAVKEYVDKYITGFQAPTSSPNGQVPAENEKVVLVTGASGSLGGHLTYHLAQLPDVKTIICLNRENKSEAYARQYKAMREKGIRFPQDLEHKLQVIQTDSAQPRFGLSETEYETLLTSTTHVVHNAWPMSAKRALDGFESQFQVVRNLIDFASEVVARRPESFKFGFQMVSSIGVVGRYGLENADQDKQTWVPERRVDIDSVLSNGYGEAKWGCEWMLDETLHLYPDRFRTMVVRLGQIAGSKTSGYWNPMEHFGFLVKSSQTLDALPNLTGRLYWTPVNDIAAALSDLVLADNTPYPVYHIENPVGQEWSEMTSVLAKALHIPSSNIVSFEEWMEKVRTAPQKDNPATTLLSFLDDNFLRMSCGGLVLDTQRTLEHSPSLREVGPVSDIVARKYVHIWKEIGFLKASEEDKAKFAEEREALWGPK